MRNILKTYEIEFKKCLRFSCISLKQNRQTEIVLNHLFSHPFEPIRDCATEKECDAFLRSSRSLRGELKSRYTLCGEIFSRVINIQHPLPFNQTRVSFSRIQLHPNNAQGIS